MGWDDELAELTTADLVDIDGGRQRALDTAVELEADGRYLARAARRHYLNATRVANAAKLLEVLPAAGESLHCIMRGHFNAFDLVPAVLRLAGVPARSLHLATLSFSRDNVERLEQLLDGGEIEHVWFLCSAYMRSVDADVFGHLRYALERRGHRCAATRNHAKVQLFELADGRRYTVETSANLRSCRNLEQFSLAADPELWQFHRQWIEESIQRAAP